MKGDWDHYSKLGLPCYRTTSPCNFCPCDKGQTEDLSFSYTNFNADAAWKRNLYSVAQWRAALRHQCWLFDLTYFSVFNVEVDELHVVHLGVSQYLAGSVLWLMTHKILNDSVSENLISIWGKVVEFYTINQTARQLSNMQLQMYTDPKASENTMAYPRLKAKGSETKHLIPALRHAWMQLARKSRSPFCEYVQNCLDRQCLVQDLLGENRFNMFLPDEDIVQLQKAVDDYLETMPVQHIWLTL